MDKKEAKIQYMRKQLEDPDVSSFDKQQIRQRLGIETIYSEDDFLIKDGYEMLSFVLSYMDDQLQIIRRKKRTSTPFDFFTSTQKTIYHLSGYASIMEEDTLEQLYDNDDFEVVKGITEGLKTIGRFSDAELVQSIVNKKITEKKVRQLLDHFREDKKIVEEIETEIEKFIRANIKDILELQNIQ